MDALEPLPDPDELTDDEFGYEIGIGFLLGIPLTFVVFFGLLLLTLHRPGLAPAIAWAAIVGGGYFGGFVALSVAMARHERTARHA